MSEKIHLYQQAETLYAQCAARILTLLQETLTRQERFHLALAGGDTPRELYRLLSRVPQASAPDWQRIEFYFGDERDVGPDHPDSNFRMAQEELFTPLSIRQEAIHRIYAERSPEEAVAHYQQTLQEMPHHNDLPQFDLILLGIGADGHIASLFPNSSLLEERQQTVSAGFVEKLDAWRFSLTLPVLNNARHIMLLVCGSKKADVIRHVLHGSSGAMPLPVELLDRERLEWFIDQEAGHFLEKECEA
jgi:6-phosphogluconolactonase